MRSMKEKMDCAATTIPLTQEAIAQSNLERMIALIHQRRTATSGVWYPYIYAKKNHSSRMDDAWWHGYLTSEYFQQEGHMKFLLKEGKSATAGIQALFEGLSLVECASLMGAIDYWTALRMLGPERFDELFGRVDQTPPEKERLVLEQYNHTLKHIKT